MSTPPPTTQTMKISEVKQQLNRLVNQIYRKETRILVEKSGIPVAAIVSADDLRRLDRLDREREAGFKALEEFAAGFKDQSPEDIERETAKALAEVRAEMRAERQQLDQERAERFKILDKIGEAFKDVPVEELEREVDRAVAEVRAERRAEQDDAVPAKT